ncbi:MAG: hypothetical protein HQK58_10540 [Deltaproteobacteria bacterium]|nr:hypothetical protein [Deltaproteobacteria bacterium]
MLKASGIIFFFSKASALVMAILVEVSMAALVLESNKTVTELYSPISGEVIEVNHDVIDNPELINEDALSDGWLIRVEPSADSEFSELLVPEEYEEYLKEEIEEIEEEE